MQTITLKCSKDCPCYREESKEINKDSHPCHSNSIKVSPLGVNCTVV